MNFFFPRERRVAVDWEEVIGHLGDFFILSQGYPETCRESETHTSLCGCVWAVEGQAPGEH